MTEASRRDQRPPSSNGPGDPAEAAPAITPLIDPRLGDVEDDALSTKQHSMLSIAGSLLAEVSLPKLLVAWILLFAVPGILFGLVPLVASAWVGVLSQTARAEVGWISSLVLLAIVVVIGLLTWRSVFRLAERAFWGLNSVAIQPGYALFREGFRHFAGSEDNRRQRFHGGSAVVAGLIVGALGVVAALLVWPATQWIGSPAELATPIQLILAALANTVFLIGCYVAVAAPVWGIFDAALGAPQDLAAYDQPVDGARTWRVVHLSDVHYVGERYGFRIESGRIGQSGNERMDALFDKLEAIDAEQPLDLIVMTGDATDAGRSSEWIEFLGALAKHPRLARRYFFIPGNHDLNVVDRANPARLELPTSPGKRLRQMRTLSAMAAVQGDRVHVVDESTRRLGETLTDWLAPRRELIETFADTGKRRLAARLDAAWWDPFPMVKPPDRPEGLGIILLNSVAETNFSFTNALGLVDAGQERRLKAVTRQFPEARWLVALHHHLVEYPDPAKLFSERVGTALINGTWFLRQILPLKDRAIALHGHRHVDWVGECSGFRIISAPSPVMEATNDEPTYFYILNLAAGQGGRLDLLAPERVDLPGEPKLAD